MPVDESALEAIDRLFPEGDWVEAIADEETVRSRLDLLRAISTDDLEIVMVGPGGFAGTFAGVEGFEGAWRDWLTPFESYHLEQEEDYLVGDDVAVFFARQHGVPKGSSAPMENDGASVFFFREGKVRRIEFHLERAAALRASGLG
jgi:ketosteroid isomerase-like protein